ncbi:MAG: UDP-N-acetylglucosamine 2-epimerase [Bacteroidota bacterium]
MRRVVFLTGTRADFGKLKSLIEVSLSQSDLEVYIFATGMHMQRRYGSTVDEIVKCGYPNIYKFINATSEKSMDLTLAKTIEGLSNFCGEIQPDLIVVHGDRVEALAGAIVGSLNNILVAHIEGGELSGTIDELIRHSVSKLSHSHFVANVNAKKRLMQMGEQESSIYVIGSPDVDVMLSTNLPTIEFVKEYYDIHFENFGLVLFHPVTTEIEQMKHYANQFAECLAKSGKNYVVVYPNNDLGSTYILDSYNQLKNNDRFLLYPSIRFEYFLVLLKNASFIIGNSSAGIREAPYYGVPTINIGTRQQNRSTHHDILNVAYDQNVILEAIQKTEKMTLTKENLYGEGNSNEKFIQILNSESFWQTNKQKQFKDI